MDKRYTEHAPHAHAPHDRQPQRQRPQLSPEEIKVLKECRVNSIFYRGVPYATACLLLFKSAETFGLLRKRKPLFYAGMCGLSFFAGVGSYRSKCLEKILALENSKIADEYRAFMQKQGIEIPKKYTEFQGAVEAIEQPSDNDEITSPLEKRMHEEKSKWDEIREARRQQTHTRKKSLNDLRKQTDPSWDENNGQYNDHPTPRRQSTFPQATKKTNEYGDEIE